MGPSTTVVGQAIGLESRDAARVAWQSRLVQPAVVTA
jgi:hypothetical protein